MSRFSPVTEDDLDRARQDPAFRQKLLQECLDVLLSKLQKHRQTSPSAAANASQVREGVTLAVRLAELIQGQAPTLPRPR
jgi:hypothetical protein